nr:MAG TPA: hypothetical protein [Caudoviricetes sp.]
MNSGKPTGEPRGLAYMDEYASPFNLQMFNFVKIGVFTKLKY